MLLNGIFKLNYKIGHICLMMKSLMFTEPLAQCDTMKALSNVVADL